MRGYDTAYLFFCSPTDTIKRMNRTWCYITISSGHKVKIDQADREMVSTQSWRVITSTTGRKKVICFMRTSKGPRNVTLGKFLMNPPKGKQVYPRRFNEELDYRRENLVICTLQQRQSLLPKNRKKGSSKYRGVSFGQVSRMWRASITVHGKAKNLGDFDDEHTAAAAYNRAAKKYFGEFAYQNKILDQKKPRKE